MLVITVVSGWVYIELWIQSAGEPVILGGDVMFKQDTLTIFTSWYTLFSMLWIVQFLYGCQHMVIAGAIAVWYFARLV